jgi:hypothetical protein
MSELNDREPGRNETVAAALKVAPARAVTRTQESVC